MYKMKMLSQLGTNRQSDQLLELLGWLFATKDIFSADQRYIQRFLLLIQISGSLDRVRLGRMAWWNKFSGMERIMEVIDGVKGIQF